MLDGSAFLPLSASVRSLSLLIDVGYWVSFLALSLVVVVQYLLSPDSWSSSEVMRPHPARLPLWKAAVISERQLACPKPQLSGFINIYKIREVDSFLILLAWNRGGFSPAFYKSSEVFCDLCNFMVYYIFASSVG